MALLFSYIKRTLTNRIYKSVKLLLLSFFFTTIAHGQMKGTGLPNIKNFTKTEYQSGTQNWDIHQDSNGNVYFANNNGLLQYDGSTWRTYRIPNSTNIRSVKFDSISGRIYVGAYNEFGYFESDEKGNLDYVSLIPKIQGDGYQSTDFIWKIHLLNDEVIFQSFTAAYILKNESITVIPVEGRFQFSFKVKDKVYFQDITKGIVEYQNGNMIPLSGTTALNGYEIWGIFPLETDRLLIATLEAGLFVYDGRHVLPWDTEANEFIKKNSSLGGVMINANDIVLNSVLGGIIICNTKGEIIQHVDLKKGLKNNTVLSSFIDSSNNLWLGLDNGISYLNINSPFTYFSSSLNLSSVYASTTHNGILYVATNQGVFYHRLQGNFTDDSFKLVEGTAAQSWNIQVISGELICANNKGAMIIKEGKVDRILDHTGYFGFKKIPEHPNLFVGSNYGGFTVFEITPNGFAFKNRVQGFYNSSKDFELESGYLWLLRDQFLYQLEFSDNLEEFSVKNKFATLGSDGNGVSTLQKINNTLYFVSNNHFYTYSKNFDSFREETGFSELFKGVPPINSISQDSYGNLWYSYNESESLGVLMKARDGSYTNVMEPFSILKGNFVYNYLSVNTIDPHNIFIGMINGLAHYDSGFSSDNLTKPKVFIRTFSFGNETIVQGNPQEKSADLELSYANNNVKFTFSSPDFENADNIQYSYQLEPFDLQWSHWSKQSIKEYTNLKEGTYTMRVKEKNNYGLESEPATLVFTVNPPWYRHFIAYIGYFMLACLIVYLIRLQVRAKIRKNRYYETIEQRRLYLEKESKIRMEQYRLEKKIQKLNRDRLKTKILAKDKELVNNSLQVVKKNKILSNIIQKLKEMDTESMNDESKAQLSTLKKSITKEINSNSWNDLEKHIKNVHFDFLKRLKEQYPDISPRELDLSTYLLMNMSTKEIAEVMNISNGGVELARYRLRKKLGLGRKENLNGFLMNI
ncbi:regulator [Flagellimonas pelagia]|uniref:Regulator n=2 Tax=Flagellimonas pelagia TaxID=2306998 RepID=A0A3A1NM35_9FLAO|nr:regulator [Allomuricauda maritima]TXK01317.1 regulator [Allomuricauda maritima]